MFHYILLKISDMRGYLLWLQNSCTSALEKYGLGSCDSCGPCGFYGTIDVHLDCESRIAKLFGAPDSILYSYGLSTMFSTIPAFCKKGDVIVVVLQALCCVIRISEEASCAIFVNGNMVARD